MATCNYTIRAACEKDVNAVAELWQMMADQHQDYDSEFWKQLDKARDIWLKRYKTLLHEDKYVTLVAESSSNKRIVGYLLGCYQSESNPFPRHRAEVWDLLVTPNWRGKGIGKKITNKAFEEFRNLGAKEVVLSTAIANKEAIGFYKHLGLRPMMYKMFGSL